MSEPPWEKMYNELEQRHVALAQKVIEAAAKFDAMAVTLDSWHFENAFRLAVDCRAEARKLRDKP